MPDESTSPTPSLDKKVVRTSPVLWILGAGLAVLLCALGTRALSDVADLFVEPAPADFRGPALEQLERERELLSEEDGGRRLRIERAERDQQALERALETAEENWRTWLETRGTLGGTADEDSAVRARRDRIERLRAERDRGAERVAALRREPDPSAEKRDALEARVREAEEAAGDAWSAAMNVWRLKVLSARLALVLPLAAVAVWLWRRRRETRYVTLLWGYEGFVVWMVGLGIYPYLPHYGGYFPLVAGVVATVALSISLVRYFNARAAARRRRIVDRAIARHRCPGCERDYLLGRETALELGVVRKATSRHFDAAALRPRACPSCGLALFGACPACHEVQLVHVERCVSCGTPWAATGPTN
ncbi:MAG TPA: hypothetical protein VLT61_05105 [Anaeromyxobacteraceae bacterium]|nr:hypothetical protein [Anaeromyxobacteraceae bacterium]